MEVGWADLARCGQDLFGTLMDALVAEAHALAPSENLVIAGGCGLNSSYNGRVLGRSPFSRLHVPSAPADDGNAVGAAWLAYQEDHPAWSGPPQDARPLTPYLGAKVSTAAMERLAEHEPRARKLGHGAVTREAARILAAGGLIGWVQGAAEFGPRSLGNRSILADPRPAGAKDALNAKVKYREAFRPFAPSILAVAGPDWFEDFADSPYMERTLVWKESVRDKVPAVVHEDGTGRLQTVTQPATRLRCPHRGLPRTDRRASAAEHQLQRDGQTDSPHGGGCDPHVLHDRPRRPRRRGLDRGEINHQRPIGANPNRRFNAGWNHARRSRRNAFSPLPGENK